MSALALEQSLRRFKLRSGLCEKALTFEDGAVRRSAGVRRLLHLFQKLERLTPMQKNSTQRFL